MNIQKPMLAGKCSDTAMLNYPTYATSKLDGIRAMMVDGKLVSRNFKPIPNVAFRTLAEKSLPNGIDGELMVPGLNFNEITHYVMKESESADKIKYYVFDYIKDDPYKHYIERMEDLKKLKLPDYCVKILPKELANETDLLAFETDCLSKGYEGVMLRRPEGPYKFGRSTEKEGYLLKLKRFSDAEGVVLEINEKMNNNNVAEKDAFGRTKRSQAQAGMSAAGTMGQLVVKCAAFKNTFGVGSGFDDATRDEIWKNKKKYLGKLAKFKYFPTGTVGDAPRFPIFLGFRDKNDTSK